ncbi:MAG: hypothetical protein WBH99_09040, partial [Azovibrio sp.]
MRLGVENVFLLSSRFGIIRWNFSERGIHVLQILWPRSWPATSQILSYLRYTECADRPVAIAIAIAIAGAG